MNEPTRQHANLKHAGKERVLPADVDPHGRAPLEINRRRFLEAAGFTLTLSALHGCSRPDPELALPLIDQPEGMIPGLLQSYASTCAGCPAGCGLLAGVRDGRPLKMEGLPEHPLSRGGLCAVGQALPLGLYDRHRLTHPLHQGEQSSWDDVDRRIGETLEAVRSSGGAVRLVTPTLTSPTLQATVDSFLSRFTDARHVVFDAVSSSAILDAHHKTHGARILPAYRLDQAAVIVSFGADFLGTWISPVEFTAAWRTRRVPTEDHPQMSHHVQLEGAVSLTGSNADRRRRLAPDEFGSVLSHLYFALAERAGQSPDREGLEPSPLAESDLADLADRLWNAREESLVLCDSQDVTVQVLVNGINHLLGNYGKTLDVDRHSRQRQGSDADVLQLVEELKGGKVAALLVAGTDLTHNLPDRDGLAEAISRTKLVVSLSERPDDFASLAHFVCPDHHPLESWLDAEPVSGTISLSQPLLQPLGDTRSILESLARWSGRSESALDILKSFWKTSVLPRATDNDKAFREFWDQAVHDGIVTLPAGESPAGEFQPDAVTLASAPGSPGDYCLSLVSRIGLTDTRHAHNPWLQELPDPVTKITWDNCVSVSTGTAEQLQLTEGDIVRVETADGIQLELPAHIQRGQHDRVISVPLGYGVTGTERFAGIGPQWLEARPTVEPGERVGRNAAPLISTQNGALQLTRDVLALTRTGAHRELATTQEHHTLEIPPNVAPHGGEVRDIVQETTLPAFAQNPEAGKPVQHVHSDVQLWADDHPREHHNWGLTIDLNACTGCSACLIACQSENNVPVVGRDEVRRQREMHWIRVDRYYSGEDDDLHVSHQPMMCQHCDNAPCETVCPVLATVHSDEGLNEQVYNRCVGTRYCANNCPYKVRRFNWFDYPQDDALVSLALNPDVAVRSRGVMEKCSMCVQRIEEGKIDARRRGEPVADGEIRTACEQSCPAQAIVFGDLNDPNSAISAGREDPRRYGVLEEFNFQQSVSYLRMVRNRDDLPEIGGEHV